MENKNKKKQGGCVMIAIALLVGCWLLCSLCSSSVSTFFSVAAVAADPLLLVTGADNGNPPTGTSTGNPTVITCGTGATGPCKGRYGLAIAQGAETIAEHLYGVPDTSADVTMPSRVLTYWNSVCPDGSNCRIDWQQGNIQCVFLITGAFALAGHPLPVAHNAIVFWSDYANEPGFEEILAGGGGMPAVGDIMVFDDSPLGGVGHVAIVVGVTLPSKGDKKHHKAAHTGTIRFAQANSYSNFTQATINLDGSIQLNDWPGYTVVGFIRTV